MSQSIPPVSPPSNMPTSEVNQSRSPTTSALTRVGSSSREPSVPAPGPVVGVGVGPTPSSFEAGLGAVVAAGAAGAGPEGNRVGTKSLASAFSWSAHPSRPANGGGAIPLLAAATAAATAAVSSAAFRGLRLELTLEPGRGAELGWGVLTKGEGSVMSNLGAVRRERISPLVGSARMSDPSATRKPESVSCCIAAATSSSIVFGPSWARLGLAESGGGEEGEEGGLNARRTTLQDD